MDVFRHQMYRLSVMEKVVGVVGRRSDGSDLVFTALVCRSSGGAAACVPPNRQLIGVVEKPLDLAAPLLARIEDRNPALGGVERMREHYVRRRIVELPVIGIMVSGCMAQEPLEFAAANGDIEAENAIAIKVRFGVPARIVMDHQGGERGSSILGDVAFGVVKEECVAPSNGWCPVLLTGGHPDHAWETADVLDDLGLRHMAIMTPRSSAADIADQG